MGVEWVYCQHFEADLTSLNYLVQIENNWNLLKGHVNALIWESCLNTRMAPFLNQGVQWVHLHSDGTCFAPLICLVHVEKPHVWRNVASLSLGKRKENFCKLDNYTEIWSYTKLTFALWVLCASLVLSSPIPCHRRRSCWTLFVWRQLLCCHSCPVTHLNEDLQLSCIGRSGKQVDLGNGSACSNQSVLLRAMLPVTQKCPKSKKSKKKSLCLLKSAPKVPKFLGGVYRIGKYPN